MIWESIGDGRVDGSGIDEKSGNNGQGPGGDVEGLEQKPCYGMTGRRDELQLLFMPSCSPVFSPFQRLWICLHWRAPSILSPKPSY